MTKNIPEDDQLFTGLKKITYQREASDSSDFTSTQEEVEAALATAPNGSIFGSSYYRVPFSFGVSVWNHYNGSESAFGKWMFKSFGKALDEASGYDERITGVLSTKGML